MYCNTAATFPSCASHNVNYINNQSQVQKRLYLALYYFCSEKGDFFS